MDEHTTDTLSLNGEWIAKDVSVDIWVGMRRNGVHMSLRWRTMACDCCMIAYSGVGVPHNGVQWRRNTVR